MTTIIHWLKARWTRVPQPRELSTVFAIIYSVALLTGLATLIVPPTSLANKVGEVGMSMMGGLIVAGAIIGMVGGAATNSKLEYIGLALQAWALSIYSGIVIILHPTQAGSQLTQLGVIVMALLGCHVVRALLIWRRDKTQSVKRE